MNKGVFVVIVFFQAEDGIRDLVRSRGLGDVYKRQNLYNLLGQQGVLSIGATTNNNDDVDFVGDMPSTCESNYLIMVTNTCLLYTSDAADERSSVDLGGRRIIKKKIKDKINKCQKNSNNLPRTVSSNDK